MSVALLEPMVYSDLDALRRGDEDMAKAAFDRLWARARPAVLRLIARRSFVGSEADDVAQDAALRLWRRRRELRAESLGGWIVLACRTGQRLALNRIARERAFEGLPDEREIFAQEVGTLDVLLREEDRRRIGETADRVWLGTPTEVESQEVCVAAAVLRLVLGQGRAAERTAAMFGYRASIVDRWLDDPALVARAAFGALCWSGADLAAHVLRPDAPLRSQEMEEALAERLWVAEWSPTEARAVCLHEIHGMDAAAILQLMPDLDPSSVAATIARSAQNYPFRARARAFLDALGTRPAPGTGLWKRVALDYATQGLGYGHLLQRAGPPAEEMGFALTRTTLDNWLGHGRLLGRLAAEIGREAD